VRIAAKSSPYRFRAGVHFKDLAPETVHRELEKLRRKGGGSISAASVVEAARPQKHPLHSAFEWDDSAAAERYRLDQARGLITSIRVEIPEQGADHQVYVHVRPAHASIRAPGVYEPQVVVARDPGKKAQLLEDMVARLRDLERSMREFERLVEGADPDQGPIVVLATQALATARDAINRLH
jgi:hypothetical protein